MHRPEGGAAGTGAGGSGGAGGHGELEERVLEDQPDVEVELLGQLRASLLDAGEAGRGRADLEVGLRSESGFSSSAA